MSQAIASTAFIIEVNSRAAGIVVRDGRGFRFHAATDDFTPLDGRGFRSAGDAHKAALRLVENPRPAGRRYPASISSSAGSSKHPLA